MPGVIKYKYKKYTKEMLINQIVKVKDRIWLVFENSTTRKMPVADATEFIERIQKGTFVAFK